VSGKALRCKHCNASLGRENNDDKVISYINSGFALIERECAEFETEINQMTEGYFKRHEYTEEELLESSHIDKIKAVAGKVGSDIGNWNAKGILSQNVLKYYEDKVELSKQRMIQIYNRIKSRRKTAWDCIKDVLLGSYHFIFNIAFYHFKNFTFPGAADRGNALGMFSLFKQASRDFEDFVYDAKSGPEDGGGKAEEAEYTAVRQHA
jgi:hypothetical protein